MPVSYRTDEIHSATPGRREPHPPLWRRTTSPSASAEIRASCIVSATTFIRLAAAQRRRADHRTPAPLFALKPEVVVLADRHATQKFPRAALRAEFATRKIGLEVMEIGAACRTYNVLVSEERRVLAAMLLPGSHPVGRVPSEGTGGESYLARPMVRS